MARGAVRHSSSLENHHVADFNAERSGAVQVLGQQGAAVHMEWLHGAGVGELPRAGKDMEAAKHSGDKKWQICSQ